MTKGFFALLAAAALAAAGCAGSEAPAAAPAEAAAPLEIDTAPVSEATIERRVSVVGSLFPNEQVVLGSEVAAPVRAVHVDFGATVRQGQVLVELDTADFELAVDRAENTLVEALAALGLGADGDEREVDVEQLPAVVEARTMLEDARTKLGSAEALYATRDIPEQRFLELQKTVAAREAGLGQARNQAAAQIAAIATRRTEVRLAREQLADAVIRAPFDGMVAERHVAPGQYVRENDPLVTVVQIDPLRLRARVPETAVASVGPGLALDFETDAFPGDRFRATVTEVSPVLDAASRTLTAEARVPNADFRLKPGMFAKISVVVDPEAPAVMVPRAALVPFAGLTKVFVVRGGAVEELEVATGAEAGDLVEVLGGALAPGEQVAVSRLDELSGGRAVEVR